MDIDATVLKQYIDTKTAELEAKVDALQEMVQSNAGIADNLSVRLVFTETQGENQG